MKKIFFIILSMFLVANSVFAASSFKADARTKRIPSGTLFKLQFLQPVTTFSGFEGDSFTAMIQNELSAEDSVIIPTGSVVRGSISKINSAKRLSRGAKLYLDFDHVVTPNGRQIPLDMAVCEFDKIYYDGGLYKNLGYGEALQNNFDRAKGITINATDYGLSAGDNAPGLQFITTPICAVGGFIGGVAYYLGKDVIDIFKKGQDVSINSGDTMTVRLLNPIDIPVY